MKNFVATTNEESKLLDRLNREKRLLKEYDQFQDMLVEEGDESLFSNVYLTDPNDISSDWRIIIKGPKGTPYEGGNWVLQFQFPINYPRGAPKVTFLNKVYHCNISESGSISLDIINTNWAPLLAVSKVCLSIVSFLDDPNPHDPHDQSKAKVYLDSVDQYNKNCREYINLYASSVDDLKIKYNLN